jgi:hypothetical protein
MHRDRSIMPAVTHQDQGPESSAKRNHFRPWQILLPQVAAAAANAGRRHPQTIYNLTRSVSGFGDSQ